MRNLKRELSLPVDVCSLLFKEIDRPKNFEKCDAKSTYSNHYRVNIYTREYDNLHQIDRIRLSDSYLCSLDGDELLFGTVHQQKLHWHKTPHFILPKSAPVNSGTHSFTRSEVEHGATFSLKK
tara:strand:+ start:693 stop:1061 length:369 start_codon:yes stop_codon:yes gene_type:complete